MIELFERHKRIFLLSGIVICILAIILTINPSAGSNILARGLSHIVTPMQRGASAGISWVQRHFAAISNSHQLVQENLRLQQENSILRFENDRLQLAGEDMAQLSSIASMRQRYANLPTVGAWVIGQSTTAWHRRYTLDRGTDDGVAVNMAVIGDGGLIGVIRRADPGSSHFVSIVDSEFSVAVTSVRTGEIGMVSGDIRLMQQGLVRMNRIEATSQIMPGDEVRTSTHSSIFPPGILVGVVESIHPNPDGHTRHAIIRPAANLDSIETVLIVIEVFGDGSVTQDDFIVTQGD